MKPLSEMTDAELLELLPEKPKKQEQPKEETKPIAEEKELEKEVKTEQQINVVVEIKPEDFHPKVDPAKTTEAKLIFKLMDDIQSIQSKMAAVPEKSQVHDNTLLEMLNSVKKTQEHLLKKRTWAFEIIRNQAGDVSDIIATEK